MSLAISSSELLPIQQSMYAAMLILLLFISLLAKNVKASKKLVNFKQFAHCVFLHYPGRSKGSKSVFCGGSLILAQVVVTSGDCLKHMNLKNRITAYFGSSLPSTARSKLGILSYKIHPKYKENNVVYNLGVVFLGKPPPMGPYIRKIILPVGPRHKNWNDEYIVTQPKQTLVTKSQLPALVQLEHDRAIKLNNRNMLSSSYTRKGISGAVARPGIGIPERKHLMTSVKDEAFMIGWVKTPALSRMNVLSSRQLTGYKVHLLPFGECNSALHNLSLPADTFCTRSKFIKHIYDNPGCGLIVTKPITQLIGIYSRLVRGVAVFINVDSHRSWIKQTTYQLYRHACNFGQLDCSSINTSSELINCTVN